VYVSPLSHIYPVNLIKYIIYLIYIYLTSFSSSSTGLPTKTTILIRWFLPWRCFSTNWTINNHTLCIITVSVRQLQLQLLVHCRDYWMSGLQSKIWWKFISFHGVSMSEFIHKFVTSQSDETMQHPYPNFASLAKLHECIPISSVGFERGFSTYTVRNRLHVSTVNTFMQMSCRDGQTALI